MQPCSDNIGDDDDADGKDGDVSNSPLPPKGGQRQGLRSAPKPPFSQASAFDLRNAALRFPDLLVRAPNSPGP